MKLILIESLNKDEENYFKIKVKDKKDIFTVAKIDNFLNELIIDAEEPIEFSFYGNDGKKLSYEKQVGFHGYYHNSFYEAHVIFSELYVHLIIKCPVKKREYLMKILLKFCQFKKGNSLK